MTNRTIFLVRHAEPLRLDEVKRYLGQSNPGLSPLGLRQAEQLAHTLSRHNIEAIYCSDLVRAEHTASIIGNKLCCPIAKIRELREISLGEWEGKSFAEIRILSPSEYELRGRDLANHRPPGGESFGDLANRAVPAFQKIVESTSGNIVVVAHAGVNRVLLCHLMRLPLKKLFQIKQDYARVNVISQYMEQFVVESLNADLTLG